MKLFSLSKAETRKQIDVKIGEDSREGNSCKIISSLWTDRSCLKKNLRKSLETKNMVINVKKSTNR